MTKSQIIQYLKRNKDILSIRAIGKNAAFSNLDKVLNGQVDGRGFAFTFPDRHVKKVSKEIKRLQTLRKVWKRVASFYWEHYYKFQDHSD